MLKVEGKCSKQFALRPGSGTSKVGNQINDIRNDKTIKYRNVQVWNKKINGK